MTTQLFIPKFRIEETLQLIKECLEKGWTGLGYRTVEFENAWKQYAGFKNAHFVNSNTSGLHAVLETFKIKYGWGVGDEIITTPLTFVSTNHAILHAGLTPIFADVDKYLCLDPADVRKKITSRTKAIMFVGLGGGVGSYAEVKKICDERGLFFIFDAAHCAGTRVNGLHAGLDADAAIFSFQAVKNLPTADSGMVCFKDDDLDCILRKLTWLGINKDTYARINGEGAYKWLYDVEYVGYKYHGNSIMASMGLVSLRYLDVDNAYRRQIDNWYRVGFGGSQVVEMIPKRSEVESSCHLFQIKVKNRDEVMLALNKHDIFPGVHYVENTRYPMYSCFMSTCPMASNASNSLISLPVHMSLTKKDVDDVVTHVLNYAK